ncbi:MAG TPA: RNA methyltransferase [Acidimicrobiales bacterium]|nr:RNA methyltransferase [Acidimicrobiales bacterium]
MPTSLSPIPPRSPGSSRPPDPRSLRRSPPSPRRDGDALALRHHRVQRLRRLSSRRSARESERAFVVEGAKVLKEALDAGVPIESVYVDAASPEAAETRRAVALADVAFERGARVFELARGVMARVTDTVTPQPVVAVVPYVDVPLAGVRDASLLVVCVDVRDPGNAGTVLRSAEAAGAGGVVFASGSVDVYNPKTVRASAGSLFHVPVVTGGDAVEVLDEVGRWGVRRLATAVRDGVEYDALDLVSPFALVLGNEAHGLPDDLVSSVDDAVTIPMAGRTESLNVGMAAAVLCFEAARQRRHAAGGTA